MASGTAIDSAQADPTRVGRDAGRIAEEVIAHLNRLSDGDGEQPDAKSESQTFEVE